MSGQKKLYKHMATGNAIAGTSNAICPICQISLASESQLAAAASLSGDRIWV